MKSPLITITANKGFTKNDLYELFLYKDIFLMFVERDLKLRYKQTVIGGTWAVIKPLISMVLFSFFFGKIAKIPSDNIPYPIFSYSGVLLWTYFSSAVTQASMSLVSNSSLVSKVYFPRIIIPLASTMVGLVDYAIASVVLMAMMVYYQIVPGYSIIFLPLLLLLTWMLATGVGFWLSATNVLFRDVQYVTSFLLQLWIYATPVIYPISVAGQFSWMVSLNPVSGLIETHRALWLGQPFVHGNILAVSVGLTIFLFVTGAMYFKKIEGKFADVI